LDYRFVMNPGYNRDRGARVDHRNAASRAVLSLPGKQNFLWAAPILYEIPIPLLSFLKTNLRSLSARSAGDRDKQ
jgi:hypothetical protein